MTDTLSRLLAGNADHVRAFADRFDDVQTGQHPAAVTVSCADSRVMADHVWGNDEPGRVFTVANIGNRVVQRTGEGEAVSGDVLYPIEHTGTETAVVLGHTGCGAVTATYDHLADRLAEPPGIDHCLGLLAPHLEPALDRLPEDIDRADAINHLVEYNVDRQVAVLRDSEDIPDAVTVVGAVYDFQDVYGGERGEVHVINVDGETDVDALREANPSIADRIDRQWAY